MTEILERVSLNGVAIGKTVDGSIVLTADDTILAPEQTQNLIFRLFRRLPEESKKELLQSGYLV